MVGRIIEIKQRTKDTGIWENIDLSKIRVEVNGIIIVGGTFRIYVDDEIIFQSGGSK